MGNPTGDGGQYHSSQQQDLRRQLQQDEQLLQDDHLKQKHVVVVPSKDNNTHSSDCETGTQCNDRSLSIVSGLAIALERATAASTQALADTEARRSSGGHHHPTVFHGLFPPVISVAAYLERMRSFANCSQACFALTYIYIDRLLRKNPQIVISDLSCHRIALSAFVGAVKFLEDSYFPNRYYAKLGGVSLSELNHLELEFLSAMNWELYATPEEIAAVEQQLVWTADEHMNVTAAATAAAITVDMTEAAMSHCQAAVYGYGHQNLDVEDFVTHNSTDTTLQQPADHGDADNNNMSPSSYKDVLCKRPSSSNLSEYSVTTVQNNMTSCAMLQSSNTYNYQQHQTVFA